MNSISRIDALVQAFFEGALTASEQAELQRVLSEDARAAEHFAELARLEAGLVEHFRVARESAKAGQVIQRVRGEREHWRYRWFAAGAAAVLMLSVGSFWYVASGVRNQESAVRGQGSGVSGQGSGLAPASAGERRKVQAGEAISGENVREVELPDGSLAVLERDARMVVNKPLEGERVSLEQMAGKATFKVVEDDAAFVVRTRVGEVTVLGTEFSVELRTGGEGVVANDKKGAEKMKFSTIMLVAVASGLVEVNVGGVSYNLLGGQSRAFAEDKTGGGGDVTKKPQKGGDPKNGMHKVAGTIGNPGAESVTLTNGDHSEVVKITPATQILIQTNVDEEWDKGGKVGKRPQEIAGTAASLVAGESAVGVVSENGEALRIVQLRHQDPKVKGDGTENPKKVLKGDGTGDTPNPKKVLKGDPTGDTPNPKNAFKGDAPADAPPKKWLNGDNTGDTPNPKNVFKGEAPADPPNPKKDWKGDTTGNTPNPKNVFKGEAPADTPPKKWLKGDNTGDAPNPKKVKGDGDPNSKKPANDDGGKEF